MKQIKGYIPKKSNIAPPDPIETSFSMAFLVADLQNAKRMIDSKIIEITNAINTAEKTVKNTSQEIAEQSKQNISNLIEEAQTIIQDTAEKMLEMVSSIEPEAGKDADEELIVQRILDRIPTPVIDEEAILSKVPKYEPVDENKLLKRFLSKIPQKKGDLKIIRETIETDPLSVIEKIMALMEDGTIKLKTTHIDGLEQTMAAFRSQLGRGYLHGGGDTVAAGTGIAITSNSNGTKTISATGSVALTIIAVTGTIDDSNVVFSAITQPTLLNINGAFYQKTGGVITWTYVGTTITLSSPVGTGGSIFGI